MNMEHNSISVVIPAYNAERYIKAALLSVTQQTLLPNEIIVVNDGSTDLTEEIVCSFLESSLSTVTTTLLSVENGGAGKARNIGAHHARCKYLAFLDADDEWVSTKLERQLAEVGTTAADIVISDCYLIDENSQVIGENINSYPSDVTDFASRVVLGKVSMVTPSILVRRDRFLAVGGFSETLKHREDHYFILNCIAHGYSVVGISSKLVRVRVNDLSMRHSISDVDLISSYTAFFDFSVTLLPVLKPIKSYYFSRVFFLAAKSQMGKSRRNVFKYCCMSLLNKISIKPMALLFMVAIPIRIDKRMVSSFWRFIKNLRVRR